MALYERLGRPHPKPEVSGCHWTDADMAPFYVDDYETDKQGIEAQMMLELAEELANARRLFALESARVAQNRLGTAARGETLYVPQVYSAHNPRRGFAVSRE